VLAFPLQCLLLTWFIGKRISRQGRTTDLEKDVAEPSTVPPPVGDASSWPTPETATNEDRKKPQSQDKGDKNDSKSPGMKPNQKWVHVPYVPSAKFNTPLPQTVSRRGGRPARGSREGGSRGGHVSQGSINDKVEKMRPMGPPPVPKQTSEQQRGRDQETSSGNRATSAPTQGRRAASVGPALSDQQRTALMAMSDRSPFESKQHAPSDPQDLSASTMSLGNEEGVTSNKSRAESRSFSRQSSASYRTGGYENTRHVSGESHAHPRSYTGPERRNTYGEPERHNEDSGRRERGDSTKDVSKTRDFESKAESWRDRDYTSERPEQRNGRGRGGYRGRGNHSAYSAAQSTQGHAFTAPLPQQQFSAGKPHVYTERHRQSSAPYAGMPPQSNHRSASRSQSIPTHGIYPGMQNNFGSALSPIQTDMHGIYGGYPTMFPGIMSAIPYNATLEPMALLSTVSAQVEYYFSIENLCKDMYLRSNMDSQGWVPLSVIAGFNRIKSLTEDLNLIRHVCQMSPNIEFRPGDDGTDRIRKLDKWDQWILDMDQRQAHAQNDGPPPLQQSQSPPHFNSGFPSMSQVTSPTWAPGPFYNGYAEPPSFSPAGAPPENHDVSPPLPGNLPEIPSGEDFSLTDGQAERSPNQSADVPGPSSPPANAQNISPKRSSPGNTGVAVVNGHAPASPQEIGVENAFSNERMNELHVCVRHPAHQFPPPFISPGARTFSHGSIDGQMPAGAPMATPIPSLRGGAGSPDG
jgi:la-related protein 1